MTKSEFKAMLDEVVLPIQEKITALKGQSNTALGRQDEALRLSRTPVPAFEKVNHSINDKPVKY